MEPATGPAPAPQLAGQLPDELLPGQNSGPRARDAFAAGTPGGGLALGGLAGTNAPYASAEDLDLEQAMGSGPRDNSGDRVADDEPQAGRSGGAIGGTPAGKRRRPK